MSSTSFNNWRVRLFKKTNNASLAHKHCVKNAPLPLEVTIVNAFRCSAVNNLRLIKEESNLKMRRRLYHIVWSAERVSAMADKTKYLSSLKNTLVFRQKIISAYSEPVSDDLHYVWEYINATDTLLGPKCLDILGISYWTRSETTSFRKVKVYWTFRGFLYFWIAGFRLWTAYGKWSRVHPCSLWSSSLACQGYCQVTGHIPLSLKTYWKKHLRHPQSKTSIICPTSPTSDNIGKIRWQKCSTWLGHYMVFHHNQKLICL